MMQKYTPDQVRFAIYDSRRVDYSFLNSNPFLIAPVYSDPSKATGLIQWSLVEARRRMNNLDQIEMFPHIFIIPMAILVLLHQSIKPIYTTLYIISNILCFSSYSLCSNYLKLYKIC